MAFVPLMEQRPNAPSRSREQRPLCPLPFAHRPLAVGPGRCADPPPAVGRRDQLRLYRPAAPRDAIKAEAPKDVARHVARHGVATRVTATIAVCEPRGWNSFCGQRGMGRGSARPPRPPPHPSVPLVKCATQRKPRYCVEQRAVSAVRYNLERWGVGGCRQGGGASSL